MKILVTGGSGMIGKHLKNTVHANRDHDTWTFLSSKDCDLRDQQAVSNLFQREQPDKVIHLAANVGGLFKNIDHNATMLIDNVRMNINVVEACVQYNIKRAIFVLSSCVFPSKPTKFPMTESMIHESEPHDSNRGYAYSKRLLLTLTSIYREQHDKDFICLTPVNMYGPYDNYHLENSHVIPGIMRRMHETHVIGKDSFTAYGTGAPLRQFLYAGDFAQIIYRVLYDYSFEHGHMICSSSTEISIAELTYLIADTVGYPKDHILYDTSKSDGCMKKTVSSDLFKQTYPDLYQNLVPLQKGLQDTYQWYLHRNN